MKLKIILLLSVVAIATCSNFKMSATRAHDVGRQHLSHTKFIYEGLNEIRQRHDLNLRHQQAYTSVPLKTNHYGFNLHLKVSGFDYEMSMDTGSSDIFIKGEKAPGVPKRRYVSAQNYKNKPTINIGYLDGPLSTYEDNLQVEFDNHKFNTPLLVAYTAPKQFEDVQGLVGLSFPSLARHKPTFIQTLIANNIVKKNAYGMNLNLIQDNKSFVSFGESDPELYQGQMNQYPMGQSSFINVNFDYVQIGNSGRMQLSKALLDTGNTCISIPRQYQNQILRGFNNNHNRCVFEVQKQVPMFSLLICQITNLDQLPVLTLSIGGDTYQIQKQFYLQRCVQNPRQRRKNPNLYYCDTYIESVNGHDSNMIFLGDAFFNRFYTFFDLEEKKIGIAKNRQNISMQDIFNMDHQWKAKQWKSLK